LQFLKLKKQFLSSHIKEDKKMFKKSITICTFIIYYILLSGLSHASVLSQVYRFWSDEKQGHFYTISETEKDYVETLPEWRYEGIAWYSWPEPISGTTPIYRFWSDEKQHHFYTISAAEKDYVETLPEWRYEGIAWYSWPEPSSGTSPIYRFWSDEKQGHFFTISAAEKDCVETLPEWRYEGIAYYAVDKSIFKIHISHLSMPSQVTADSEPDCSVKFEEGDFNSIGDAQAMAIIPVGEEIWGTMIYVDGGLNLTGNTISFQLWIPPNLEGSGIIWIVIVDASNANFDLNKMLEVSNSLEHNITTTTLAINQSQEFSTTDDLNVTYEFLSEDKEIIKDGLKLQSPLLK